MSEVTWRATKIRTKAGNFVIVPNSVVAKETITNYSEPTPDRGSRWKWARATMTPPNEVKAAIRRSAARRAADPSARGRPTS